MWKRKIKQKLRRKVFWNYRCSVWCDINWLELRKQHKKETKFINSVMQYLNISEWNEQNVEVSSGSNLTNLVFLFSHFLYSDAMQSSTESLQLNIFLTWTRISWIGNEEKNIAWNWFFLFRIAISRNDYVASQPVAMDASHEIINMKTKITNCGT